MMSRMATRTRGAVLVCVVSQQCVKKGKSNKPNPCQSCNSSYSSVVFANEEYCFEKIKGRVHKESLPPR